MKLYNGPESFSQFCSVESPTTYPISQTPETYPSSRYIRNCPLILINLGQPIFPSTLFPGTVVHDTIGFPLCLRIFKWIRGYQSMAL